LERFDFKNSVSLTFPKASFSIRLHHYSSISESTIRKNDLEILGNGNEIAITFQKQQTSSNENNKILSAGNGTRAFYNEMKQYKTNQSNKSIKQINQTNQSNKSIKQLN